MKTPPKSRVALVRCDSYDDTEVNAAVKRGFGLIGAPEKFVRPGEKILLKPNLLAAEPPESATTTHPAVFKAVARQMLAAGALLSYGDSPAYQSMRRVAQKAGFEAVADELGIPAADFSTPHEVFFKAGRQNKRFVIAKGVTQVDGLVSLPKLKTHGLERLTGSIKNQFGCVPGLLKGEYHVKIPDAHRFAKMLVDLNALIKPRLYIMDGIRAMEGNGPRGGRPVAMNVLLFAVDPVALDATVCRLIDLDPAFVPTTRWGQEFGQGTFRAGEIELVGDGLEDFKNVRFDARRKPVRSSIADHRLRRLLDKHMVTNPVVRAARCVRCGVCIKVCPTRPKAIDWPAGSTKAVPVHDYEKCIRCYCCQELCPESAIELYVPPLRKLWDIADRVKRDVWLRLNHS